jgi:hypothetical protein
MTDSEPITFTVPLNGYELRSLFGAMFTTLHILDQHSDKLPSLKAKKEVVKSIAAKMLDRHSKDMDTYQDVVLTLDEAMGCCSILVGLSWSPHFREDAPEKDLGELEALMRKFANMLEPFPTEAIQTLVRRAREGVSEEDLQEHEELLKKEESVSYLKKGVGLN